MCSGRALDPEGFVVNPKTGRFLVSDEYGPSLYEFNRDGTLARTFTTPANLIPRNDGGTPNFADNTGNTKGRNTNRGFEGLAISPDGKFAYAMLQSPMLDEFGLTTGRYNRIVKFDIATGLAVAQYAYLMEGSSQGRGISALVALNDHEFLVLERNNRGVGVASDLSSPNKKVFKIDITGASDVTDTPCRTTAPPAERQGAGHEDCDSFLEPRRQHHRRIRGRVPEKMEGLAIGPRLADGQYLILAGTDNDFSVTQIAGSTTQFDVYYNPTTGARIQCDLGTFNNCHVINSDGTLSNTSVPGDATSGFALIPGLLYAFKSTGSDLASFVAPPPCPSRQRGSCLLPDSAWSDSRCAVARPSAHPLLTEGEGRGEGGRARSRAIRRRTLPCPLPFGSEGTRRRLSGCAGRRGTRPRPQPLPR